GGASRITRDPSPRVRFRRSAPRPRPDLVEALHGLLVERDLERAERAGQLLQRARADDRRRHGGVRQRPRQRDVRGLLAAVAAEALPGLDLRAVLRDLLA